MIFATCLLAVLFLAILDIIRHGFGNKKPKQDDDDPVA